MRKIIAAILCAALLFCTVSCSTSESEDGDVTHAKNESTEKIRPSGYSEGDLSYTLSISDGYRTVSLACERVGEVTRCSVSSPEEMRGVSVIYDAAGLRISAPEGEEFSVTDEAALGLAVLFDAMRHNPSEDERTAADKFAFTLKGYDAVLTLDKDGFPRLLEVTCGGVKRCVEVSKSMDDTSVEQAR